MVRRVEWILLITMMVCRAQGATAQVAGGHHPPESANAYIKSLEDPAREEWQKPEEVVEKLALKLGASVADIGAGSGYFALRFAHAVGPTGKVVAVDIDREMLAYIEQRAKEEHLQNIQTVLADPHDPKLPPSSVDLVFICDTLHHIAPRERYYPLLARALKPGGKLVDIDFHKRPLPLGPPESMKIAKEDVINEVQAAGFHLLDDYNLLPYQYFLVFGR